MSPLFRLIAVLLLSLSGLQAERVKAVSMHNSLKHPEGLNHFAIANPKAPKGGTIRLGFVGTFNTTNPYVLKGTAPWGMSLITERLVFESLMVRAPNEPFSMYGHIAETCEIAPDKSTITFYINPKARWADGKPITPKDVLFSFETFKTQGLANQRLVYKRIIKVELVGTDGIKFTLKPLEDNPSNKPAYDPELPLIVAMMSVIPEHYFKDRKFDYTTLDPLLGSGPYAITEVKAPKKIVYTRRPDYWAKDLPTTKGLYNFDRIEVNYYRDDDVSLIAFGNGDYDVRIEENPGKWKKAYNFKAIKDGRIKITELPNNTSMGMWGYAFNTRNPIFKDVRVRQALSMLFPFQWINKTLYDGDFKKRNSYFQNTDLSCQTDPAQAIDLPSITNENNRQIIKKAQELLKEAGWVTKGNTLVNLHTQEPFVFELLLPNKQSEKVALTFANYLRKVGITTKIKVLDPAQLEQRRLSFSFDMLLQQWLFSRSPGNEQKFYWSSPMANQAGSRNYLGIASPAIDALCEKVARSQTRAELKAATHALDRELLNGFYVIPLYYNPKHFVAYWDKFGYPPHDPDYAVSVMGLWAKDLDGKKVDGQNK